MFRLHPHLDLSELKVRMSSPVFPGQTLLTQMWLQTLRWIIFYIIPLQLKHMALNIFFWNWIFLWSGGCKPETSIKVIFKTLIRENKKTCLSGGWVKLEDLQEWSIIQVSSWNGENNFLFYFLGTWFDSNLPCLHALMQLIATYLEPLNKSMFDFPSDPFTKIFLQLLAWNRTTFLFFFFSFVWWLVKNDESYKLCSYGNKASHVSIMKHTKSIRSSFFIKSNERKLSLNIF